MPKILVEGELHPSGLEILKQHQNIDLMQIKGDWDKSFTPILHEIDGLLLRGFAQVSQSGQASLGQRVFMGDNGIITGSAVGFASGDFVRIVGHVVDSGNTNGSCSIYFNPDNTWVELS